MMCTRALIAVAAVSVVGMGCGIEVLHAFAFGALFSGGLSVMAVIGRTKQERDGYGDRGGVHV